MNFMNSFEARLIRRDAKEMVLNSAESADILIHYLTISGATLDEVYDEWVGGVTLTGVIEAKAIQKIVQPKEEQVLKWGILESGDCIFYLDTSVDLTIIEHATTTKINVVNDSVEWIPVPRHANKGFHESIVQRVGNVVLFQPLPAKLSR